LELPAQSLIFELWLDSLALIQKDTSVRGVVSAGLAITSEHLSFTTHNASPLPHELFRTQSANCIGYAAFFISVWRALRAQNGLEDTWQVEQHIAQLYLLGYNVHRWFRSPFFRDHDIVVLRNKQTGQIIAVDPSLHDYLLIETVSFRN
jgi:hypothetical protein